jgi:hypothetical protein
VLLNNLTTSLALIFSKKGGKPMDKVIFDAGHIFNHYLEKSIPPEEWKRMSVEEALGIAKDTAALMAGSISPDEFGEKYRLPRK